MVLKINSPLSVPVSKKKKFILNLNNYRNAHYQTLNKAKAMYKVVMTDQIKRIKPLTRVKVHYTLYAKTKRLTDIGNVIAIHKKFFEDALTELGVIPDDNYKHILFSSESFGGVDKESPRVEITLFDLAQKTAWN